MPSVHAAWAMAGKRPGASTDYELLAASREPFSRRQCWQLLSAYSPGNPPVDADTVASLPWVWFLSITLNDERYLGVAVRTWMLHGDAHDRPVHGTKLFWVPFAETASTLFSDLYDAVADVDLPWNVPDPFAGDAIRLDLPEANPAGGVAAVGRVGLGCAAAAAAGLLDGPVTLHGGAGDLRARLAALDAVTALLPAGARAWLPASTWAAGSEHRLQLTFARRAPVDGTAVDLRERNAPAFIPEYGSLLLQLCDRRGVADVVAHLARQWEIIERNTAEITEVLVDLDIADIVLAAAGRGRLQVSLVRRMHRVGRFVYVDPKDQDVVVAAYLTLAKATDLQTDITMLAEHWSEGLHHNLATITSQRLQEGWSVEELGALGAVAVEVGAAPDFVRALIPDDDPPDPRQLRRAAAVVVGMRPRWRGHDLELAHLLVDHDRMVVAVIRCAFAVDRELAREWLQLLGQVGSTSSRPWSAFRMALLGGVDEDMQSLDALDRVDRDALVELLDQVDASSISTRFAEWVLGAVQLVIGSGHGIPAWIDAVRGRLFSEDRLRAEADLALFTAGRRPGRDLTDPAADGYRAELVRAADRAGLNDSARRQVVAGMIANVLTGWSADPSRAGALLNVLWHVLRPLEVRAPGELVTALTDEVVRNPALLEHPQLEPWEAVLDSDPRFRGQMGVRRIAAEASVSDVADRVVAMLAQAYDVPTIAATLMRSKWRPAGAAYLELAAALVVRLAASGMKNPDVAVATLLRTVLSANNGARAADLAPHLPAASAGLVSLAIWTARVATSHRDMIDHLHALREWRAELDAVVKDLERADRLSRRRRGGLTHWLGRDGGEEG